MQSSGSEDDRNVVPRWRAPSALSGWEIAAQRVLPNTVPLSIQGFSDDLARWRAENSSEGDADIFSAALLVGDRNLVWEAGLRLIARQDTLEERLLDIVKRELTAEPKPGVLRNRLAELESGREYIYSTIKMLKRRVNLSPRDPINVLELARHYAILGQYEKAEKFVHWAYQIAPNERIILRSLVQFYDLMGNIEYSLPYIRKSDLFRYDPLIQSAEIAAAELGRRSTQVAKSVVQSVKSAKQVSKSRSELAMALATLENNAGSSERSIFKIVQAGLASPTENATAQAIWLGEQSSRPFPVRFPRFSVQDDAFEARAYLAFEQGAFEHAARLGYRWSLDQPMQSHPLTFLCNCIAVYLEKGDSAIAPAHIILRRHSSDWAAVNAAFLAFALNGLREEAKAALRQLKAVSQTPLAQIFSTAGEGLYEFAFGEPTIGRESYLLAMRLAKEEVRNDLVFNAAAFYVFCEARAGVVDTREVAQAVSTLDRLLHRVAPSGRADAERLWSRLKQRIVLNAANPPGPQRTLEPQAAMPIATLIDHLGA